MARANATIDHDTIKQWVEAHDGCPAHVKNTGSNGEPGILRIDYAGFSGRRALEKISWKSFFDAFERNKLAFLYQDGKETRFSKLVSRDSVDVDDGAKPSRRSAKRASAAKQSARKSTADAIDFLTRQHREVEELFGKLQGASSEGQRERVFWKLADALAAHTKIQEERGRGTGLRAGTRVPAGHAS